MGAEGLRLAKSRIDAQEITVKYKSVLELLSQSLSPATAAALKNVVFGLSSAWSRDLSKVQDVVDALSRALDAEYHNDIRFAKWRECIQPLVELFNTESVFLSAKAIDVSYDFERVLTSCRVLTSMRPVYNVARSDILGVTVVQTLRLEYVSSEGISSNISIALDIDDLENLRNACIDGLKKAELARESAEEKWSIEAIVAGEER